MIVIFRFVKSPFDSTTSSPFVQEKVTQRLKSTVVNSPDNQSPFCSKFANDLGANLDRRSKEKGLFTNTYTEAISKLIEVSKAF